MKESEDQRKQSEPQDQSHQPPAAKQPSGDPGRTPGKAEGEDDSSATSANQQA